MKFTYFLAAILLVSSISCKKDAVEPIEIEIDESATDIIACDTCTERFMEHFSNVSPQIRVCITNQGFTLGSSISQLFNYKLIPADEVDGAYFYKVQRKVKCNYEVGAYETDFEDSPGFYRYDYENQKAYHYAALDDDSPLLLMDFNHEVGDSIIIGEAGDDPILFVVKEKEIFLLDGYPMPKLKGHLWESSMQENSDFSGSHVQLTPYYPNPVWIDRPWAETRVEWDESNFCDWLEGYTLFKFSHELRSADDEILSYGDLVPTW